MTSRAGMLYLVHVVTHATRARLDADLAPHGLSSFQFTVLSVIAHNDGLSSSNLSRRFHVTPQAMGEVVLLLERKGMILRTENPKNRKVLHLSLTSAGLATWRAAAILVERFEQTMFAGRTDSELQVMRDALSAVLTRLREPAMA